MTITFDPSHSQQIIDYYQNVYIYKCPINDNFWASSSAISWILRISPLFLPLHFFVAYCISYKTPKPMKFIKISLLITHFWCSFCDFALCVLFKPYAFFPMLAGYPMGLMQTIRIPIILQFYFFTVAMFCMSISFCAMSENRFSSITTNKFRIVEKRKRFILLGCLFLLSFIYQIPICLNPPDQNSAKLEALNEYDCPTIEFFTSPVLFYTRTGIWKQYAIISNVVICSLFLALFTFFGIVSAYYLYFVPSNYTSNKTQKMQRAFFIACIIQISIPFIFLVIPLLTIVYCVASEISSPVLNNFTIIFVSFHGVVSSILVLIIYHPYRSYVKSLIISISKCILLKKNNISVAAVCIKDNKMFSGYIGVQKLNEVPLRRLQSKTASFFKPDLL